MNHTPKGFALGGSLNEIDSFQMFNKSKEGLEWVRRSADKVLFETFSPYQLKALFLDDNTLRIELKKEGFAYNIITEKKSCNFGGFYCFFHCPACKKRMRKLYCKQGTYLCRKCANLGYLTQKLTPTLRNFYMKSRIEEYLNARGGSLKQKPPRMKNATYIKLKKKLCYL